MKADAATRAEQVLDHVYRALIAMPPFTLRDGTKVELSDYINPEKNDEGDMHCGFDALLGDGSHLEFTMTNTGWGKALDDRFRLKPSNDAGPDKKPRGR